MFSKTYASPMPWPRRGPRPRRRWSRCVGYSFELASALLERTLSRCRRQWRSRRPASRRLRALGRLGNDNVAEPAPRRIAARSLMPQHRDREARQEDSGGGSRTTRSRGGASTCATRSGIVRSKSLDAMTCGATIACGSATVTRRCSPSRARASSTKPPSFPHGEMSACEAPAKSDGVRASSSRAGAHAAPHRRNALPKSVGGGCSCLPRLGAAA